MSPSGPALSIVQYVGKEVSSDPWTLNTIFGPKKKVLDSTNGVSSKSIKDHPCACAVERHKQTVYRNLKMYSKPAAHTPIRCQHIAITVAYITTNVHAF